MTMQGVYNDGTNDVLRPVAVTADGEILVASGTGSTGLTDTQLRASPVPILAQVRTCLGTDIISGLSTTVAASLTSIPTGAVTAEIQANGGSIRIRRDGVAPTATRGWRVDDGLEKTIDSDLTQVRLLALASAVDVQISYFNRV